MYKFFVFFLNFIFILFFQLEVLHKMHKKDSFHTPLTSDLRTLEHTFTRHKSTNLISSYCSKHIFFFQSHTHNRIAFFYRIKFKSVIEMALHTTCWCQSIDSIFRLLFWLHFLCSESVGIISLSFELKKKNEFVRNTMYRAYTWKTSKAVKIATPFIPWICFHYAKSRE